MRWWLLARTTIRDLSGVGAQQRGKRPRQPARQLTHDLASSSSRRATPAELLSQEPQAEAKGRRRFPVAAGVRAGQHPELPDHPLPGKVGMTAVGGLRNVS